MIKYTPNEMLKTGIRMYNLEQYLTRLLTLEQCIMVDLANDHTHSLCKIKFMFKSYIEGVI